ncbi:MAG: phytanoyl-CoA dioxygenase family protein, partial [Pseudomonadota bacterium]
FVSRGLVALSPAQLGVSPALHDGIYERETALFRAKEVINSASIPEILDLLAAPGLVAAVDQLLGPGWAIVPFTHNTPFVSGAYDQHWHKDDNGPYNGRWPRHHEPVQIEMLYFPQAVTAEMGPTATIPYSQYWTFNHEENHDNFAGAEHLDFDYQLIGMETVPVSGRRSNYAPEEIVAGTTAHDVRMREAVADTGWPLVAPFEAAPLEAGSVLLYSHNLFHRGNHRRDPFEHWRERPRFMWRFWLYRTTDPDGEPTPFLPVPEHDAMTAQDLSAVDANLTTLWRHHYHWALSGLPPALGTGSTPVTELAAQLEEKYDRAEPRRLGAAYRLANHEDDTAALALLGTALSAERESVRRAASFGLIACGERATHILLQASHSPRRWLRKAGVHGLGSAAALTPETFNAVAARLAADASVAVRSTAAHALGSLARRALARNSGTELLPELAQTLASSLLREENRLSMDRAQGRSIKFVRPTDDSDLCEGIGISYGVDRFGPVRSAVKENALVACVILCTHGARHLGGSFSSLLSTLAEIAKSDDNVFCVGLAQDALARLAQATDLTEAQQLLLTESLEAALAASPIHCHESLLRGGIRVQQPEAEETLPC